MTWTCHILVLELETNLLVVLGQLLETWASDALGLVLGF